MECYLIRVSYLFTCLSNSASGYTCSGYVMLRVPHNMSMNTMAADMVGSVYLFFTITMASLNNPFMTPSSF